MKSLVENTSVAIFRVLFLVSYCSVLRKPGLLFYVTYSYLLKHLVLRLSTQLTTYLLLTHKRKLQQPYFFVKIPYTCQATIQDWGIAKKSMHTACFVLFITFNVRFHQVWFHFKFFTYTPKPLLYPILFPNCIDYPKNIYQITFDNSQYFYDNGGGKEVVKGHPVYMNKLRFKNN